MKSEEHHSSPLYLRLSKLALLFVGLALALRFLFNQATAINPAHADALFREDFESGLARWRIDARTATITSDKEQIGNHFLRLDYGDAAVQSLALPPEFVLSARVRFVERRRFVEAPFKLHLQPDGRFVQVYLEGTTEKVEIVIPTMGGWQVVGSAPSPVPLKVGAWLRVRIVCAEGLIGVAVNDKPALLVREPLPKAGGLGLRLGDALTDYDDLTVTAPTQIDRTFGGFRNLPGAPLIAIKRRVSTQKEGNMITIEHDDLAAPLRPLEVKVSGAQSALTVTALAPDGRRVFTRRLNDKTGGRIELAGPLGDYSLMFRSAENELARSTVRLVAESGFETDDPGDAKFFETLKRTVQGDSHIVREGNRVIRANPTWVRDHVHEMKAYQWWETDLISFIDRLIELQPRRGFFHEIVTNLNDGHLTFVTPEFVYRDEKNGVGFIRLELEADVEYLMVEGAYHIWQATGDDHAMARRLPALERGLYYNLEDPTRWDEAHGLLKRPFTIDTWDYTWGVDTSNRRIDPDMPMAIMHGDNSGLYQACLRVAQMREALGERALAKQWRETARGIRERANRLLWTGKFYQHQYHLQAIETGADERKMLSLSNTYDINRGMPTHEMAVSIIDEYRARRKRNPRDFAEWYALDPPYPQFVWSKPGEYINGGIAGFVAGELAKASLRHGREDYGADILHRVRELTEKTGTLYFLMRRDGSDQGGGPSGWSAAAVLSALMEGLAGIVDRATLFREVEVSPRYVAAGIAHARACLRYGPSDAYVLTDYRHNAEAKTIALRLAGSPRVVRLHVLLPISATPTEVRINGRSVRFAVSAVEQSRYCDFTLHRSGLMETGAVIEYRKIHAG